MEKSGESSLAPALNESRDTSSKEAVSALLLPSYEEKKKL